VLNTSLDKILDKNEICKESTSCLQSEISDSISISSNNKTSLIYNDQPQIKKAKLSKPILELVGCKSTLN
ncbi:11630_t:CDS:1, partial [Gigaspora margarita]